MGENESHGGENYRVVFLGLLDPSEARVQEFAEKVSTAFRIPKEKALRIVEKAPVVIKKGIPMAKAQRYEQFFVALGGQVKAEPARISAQAAPAAERPSRVEGLETTVVHSQEQDPRMEGSSGEIPALREAEDRARAYDDEMTGAYHKTSASGDRPAKESQDDSPFHCPQCGQEQEKRDECIKCGIIFEKLDRMAQSETEIVSAMDNVSDSGGQSLNDLEVRVEPAGFWIRLGAYAVDNLVFGLAVGVLAVLLFLLMGGFANLAVIASVGPILSWGFAFLFFAYHIYFLGKRGYTPGKGFLGLQVIRRDGTGMSYGDAAIRTFSYILSSIPLNLGFFWIGLDRDKQGWHDKIAKTQVIKAEEVSAFRKWLVLVPVILLPLIAIVAGIAIPVYSRYASRADVIKAVSEMESMKERLEEHFYRYDKYPLTGEFTAFLRSTLGHIPTDPFTPGRPYRYTSDGSRFILWSIGPDGKDNGATVRYDPFRKRSFNQRGDIVIRSHQRTDQGDELFGVTLEGTGQWVVRSD